MGEPKIVITGTGRAGTTLLVQLLDELGLDTGLHDGKLSPYGPAVRAGLESRVDDPDAPRVVKDMTLGHRIDLVLAMPDVSIEHVIIPDRRLDIAAASRIRAAAYGRFPFRRGALTGTLAANEQQAILARMRADIIEALDREAIPYTILQFPRFATDAAYTHASLGFLVPDASVADVQSAMDRCVQPQLIHEEPLTARERVRTLATSSWMKLVRFPIARLRNRLDPEGAKERLRRSVAASRAADARRVEEERLPGHHADPS